ncbi:helix-turn-helix domain-containing protein [Streptomyces sp. MRC013]|uniref:PucR family transcriptional regulator n=1 Tax=Streptomyces sp. MRC013 TaxID=2898276 RepID=UPI0020273854|nr:helix-turn-helix domain-containing protein [Streptomyces sp. MRC013]URM89257.1 helix-turn-helix domain-containing protein [Streptomyces sp. MRC013]
MAGDITEVVRRNLALFADVLRRRRPLDGGRLRELAASAVQRAEEGVPVQHVFSAYHVGMRVVWKRMAAGVAPEDLPDLVETTVLLLDHLRVLTETVVGAYVHERLQVSGREQAGRRSLLAALLEGRAPGADAETDGPRPAEAYVLLALAVSAHPDERGEDAGARIAARRKLRRLTGTLQEWVPEHALVALDTGGGTVLLPLDCSEAADAGSTARRVDALVARASRRAGADVRAAAVGCRRADVPHARTEAAEVLRVVLAQGRPPGVYRLDDVLLEVQLSRPGPALDRLVRLLDPLETAPELLATLTEYLAHGQSRKRAAAALHVHPNTVDYRLRRVAELTELDLHSAADVVRLTAALIGRSTRPGHRTGARAP